MTEHERIAGEYFLGGYVCAQAVFCAFADVTGLERAVAARLSSSFGGGMGRLRETCGALSGALLAAGMLYGFDAPVTQGLKSEHYARVQELAVPFRAEFGSLSCRDILSLRGADASTDPTPSLRTAEYYSSRPCLACVRAAARILDEYMVKYPPRDITGEAERK